MILAAQNAIEAGDLAAAVRLLDPEITRHPAEAALLNLIGVIHARRDELPAARREFAEAVRLSPALTPAWQNLARACQLQMDEDSSAPACAINAWQSVLARKPTDSEAHLGLARLYNRNGRYSQSLAEVRQLSADDARKVVARLIRCSDLAALGRSAEAKTLASGIAADADFSEEDFNLLQDAWAKPASDPLVIELVTALDRKQAASAESLRLLAVAYERQHRVANARSALERVALLDPTNPAHLIELARLAELTDAHEDALGYLGHARELAPHNARIHFLFAMVSMRLNLPVEARASLSKALAIEPENPAYNYAMGFVILSTRDAATASDYFKKSVAARPTEPKGHYALGVAYFASGDWDRAKTEMEQVEHNPSTAGGAEYFLGRIARLENEFDISAQHLRTSIELLPDFSESHTELARVYLKENKLVEANAQLQKALAIDPRSFPANQELLVIYRRTRDPRAEAQAELLTKLDEDRSKRAELMLRTIEIRP